MTGEARTFFRIESDGSFLPTEFARGPWAADACHAGPPTGLLARCLEQDVPDKLLSRLTVNLFRPVPMAGFRIDVEVLRQGRVSATARARLFSKPGKLAVEATGLFVQARSLEAPRRPHPVATPCFEDSREGPFPVTPVGHQLPGFINAVSMRSPAEMVPGGPNTFWMKALPLLPDESPSPFQRICPLADCGNALSRLAEMNRVSCVNADLTIYLHRQPEGEWLGSRSVSHWSRSGIGLSDAELFDAKGPVGRANQTMILEVVGDGRPA